MWIGNNVLHNFLMNMSRMNSYLTKRITLIVFWLMVAGRYIQKKSALLWKPFLGKTFEISHLRSQNNHALQNNNVFFQIPSASGISAQLFSWILIRVTFDIVYLECVTLRKNVTMRFWFCEKRSFELRNSYNKYHPHPCFFRFLGTSQIPVHSARVAMATGCVDFANPKNLSSMRCNMTSFPILMFVQAKTYTE